MDGQLVEGEERHESRQVEGSMWHVRSSGRDLRHIAAMDDVGVWGPQVAIVVTAFVVSLCGIWTQMERGEARASTWLADPAKNPHKRAWESMVLYYSIFWQAAFAAIIYFKMFLWFEGHHYMGVCFGLCVPLFVYPLINSEGGRTIGQRFSVKASVWIAVFSHIGNYWYTHYFYSVLKAKYTFPSWRLNNVPFCLYFATFFYFATYHTLSNVAIRKVVTTFKPSAARSAFTCCLVMFMSYVVAFMETITISGFPYYAFENRSMAYSVGSAFYGIYFLVSFPMFYTVDEDSKKPHTLAQTFWEAMGSSMLVLCMLDAVRLGLDIDFQMKTS